MSMITITNGTLVTTVSGETYENKFKKNGWRRMRTPYREPVLEDDPDNLDIEKIPVSDMNGDQLKQYAKDHDIDISKTKSAAEARKIIQTAIRNKNM